MSRLQRAEQRDGARWGTGQLRKRKRIHSPQVQASNEGDDGMIPTNMIAVSWYPLRVSTLISARRNNREHASKVLVSLFRVILDSDTMCLSQIAFGIATEFHRDDRGC